jgi:hypothetical protein
MPRCLSLVGMFVAVLGGCSIPPTVAQSPSPCLAAADTAASLVQLATERLSKDSTALADIGMPYRPSVVQLVTDTTVCQDLINRYNLKLTDSAYHVQRAYIVRAGNAYVFHAITLPPHRRTYSFFDSTKVMRVTVEGLD